VWAIVTDNLTFGGNAVDRYADIMIGVARAIASGGMDKTEERLEPIVDDIWQWVRNPHADAARPRRRTKNQSRHSRSSRTTGQVPGSAMLAA
jgi:hypothetical protein